MVMHGTHIVSEIEIKVLDYLNIHGPTKYSILSRELRFPKSGMNSLMYLMRRLRMIKTTGLDSAIITTAGSIVLKAYGEENKNEDVS